MSKTISMENGADNADVNAKDQTFADCTAEGSNFDGATLARMMVIDCDLYWASFFMAKLSEVVFENCDLRGADFKKAVFENCRFLNCDLGQDAIGGNTEFDAGPVFVEFVNCRGR